MIRDTGTPGPPLTPQDANLQRDVFEALYRLPAQEVMNRDLESIPFISPHVPVEELITVFLDADHAWVRLAPDSGRRVASIVLRQDILRALEPGHASYSRLSEARFRSLSHGSADCACCFHEGRILHPLSPKATCRDALGLMAGKRVLFVPVLDRGELVGEIGAADVLRALERVRRRLGGAP